MKDQNLLCVVLAQNLLTFVEDQKLAFPHKRSRQGCYLPS
jgi:hypothetical protein